MASNPSIAFIWESREVNNLAAVLKFIDPQLELRQDYGLTVPQERVGWEKVNDEYLPLVVVNRELETYLRPGEVLTRLTGGYLNVGQNILTNPRKAESFHETKAQPMTLGEYRKARGWPAFISAFPDDTPGHVIQPVPSCHPDWMTEEQFASQYRYTEQ